MDENKFLTFYIDNDIFALDVLMISEIIPYSRITYIPKMQPYIKGVMNIRGQIVPIVSLDIRLKLNVEMHKKKRSIIIISLNYNDEPSLVGVIVNKVDQVFTLNQAQLELPPTFGAKIPKNFIHNIAKFDDKFISILDMNEILNLQDLSTTLQDMD